MTVNVKKQSLQTKSGTSVTASLIDKLNALFSFAETQVSLEEMLERLAVLAAEMLDADDCSIVLFDGGQNLSLPSISDFGKLIATQGEYQLEEPVEPVITSNVFSHENGKPQPSYDAHKRSMFAVMKNNGKTVGMIQAYAPKKKQVFESSDLKLLEIAALAMAKSIQLIQLQNILNSRFANFALALNLNNTINPAQTVLAQHPNQITKIVAKSFYGEMKKAGFGRNQIINAVSEILSQLNADMHKPSLPINGA